MLSTQWLLFIILLYLMIFVFASLKSYSTIIHTHLLGGVLFFMKIFLKKKPKTTHREKQEGIKQIIVI